MSLAIGMALLAAFLFGLNVHIQRVALDDTDARSGTVLSVAGMTATLWLVAPWWVEWSWFRDPAMLIFIAVGLMWPAMGQSMQIKGTEVVGPALASSLGAFTPVFAVALAVTFLGEQLAWADGVGIALMVGGLVFAAWSPKAMQRQFPMWALLIPLGAALARGLGQPLSAWGMRSIPSPFFSTLIAGSTSLVLLILLYPTPHRKQRLARRGMRLFALSGVSNGMGILAMNVGMQNSSVSLVAPLVATSPLMALALGAWVFRREHLGRKHVIVAALVFIGTLLLIADFGGS